MNSDSPLNLVLADYLAGFGQQDVSEQSNVVSAALWLLDRVPLNSSSVADIRINLKAGILHLDFAEMASPLPSGYLIRGIEDQSKLLDAVTCHVESSLFKAAQPGGLVPDMPPRAATRKAGLYAKEQGALAPENATTTAHFLIGEDEAKVSKEKPALKPRNVPETASRQLTKLDVALDKPALTSLFK